MSQIRGPQDRFAQIEAVVGETYSGEVIVYQGDGVTPVNLTGYTCSFKLYNDTTLVATASVTTVPTQGIVDIVLSAAQMAALSPVAYDFELWADNGAGQKEMIIWGWFWPRGKK